MGSSRAAKAALALMLAPIVRAQSQFSIATTQDVIDTSATLAFDLLSYYKGNLTGHVPGILPGPPPDGDYYWWEGGAMWGTMMDYWLLTGDATYNSVTMDAMLFQTGRNNDYQPRNWTASLGNDDQGFWGMSAMRAAEVNFPNPPEDEPQWLALAQAVWSTQASPERHDEECGGGMRWQIPLSNNGYSYKNSIANGCFFNLGARLARYTNNDTYVEWAEETYNWMKTIGYIDENYNIYDGGHVEHDCTDINKAQFSYNVGIFAQGVAYLYNYTESEKWKTELDGLVQNALDVFFPDSVAYEVACETQATCTTDMLSFKGYVHRWLSQVTQLAPYLKEKILPVLMTSATAGLATCTGGPNQRECGFTWSTRTFDKLGAGQQMNVLAAVSSLLIEQAPAPLTNLTGGTSEGDYTAGTNSVPFSEFDPLSAADKAGGVILTVLMAGGAAATFGWMSWGA